MFARGRLLLAAAVAAPIVAYASLDRQIGEARPRPDAHVARIDAQRAKLKLVQVVFRHGARTPLARPYDLWQDTTWDVCGNAYEAVPLKLQTLDGGARPECKSNEKQIASKLKGGSHMGELTVLGQQQALELGQWLRQRYVKEAGLLPSQYTDGVVASRTTNFQRTVATLAGVLTGLYPATTTPIPAIVSSGFDEVLFADSKNCPHLGLFMKAAKARLLEGLKTAEQQDLKRRLRELMPWMPDSFWAEGKEWLFVDVHDVWTSLKAHGKPLPAGVTPELLADLNRVSTEAFRTFLAPSLKDENGKDVLRLTMGRLIGIMMGHMERAAGGPAGSPSSNGNGNGNGTGNGDEGEGDGPLGAALYLYSGHDSTVMPILSTMGHDVTTWPPYLSNVIFELWEQPVEAGQAAAGGSGTQHLVRVLYNLEELPLPGTPPGYAMELGAFKERVMGPFALSEQDLREACHAVPSHDSAHPVPAISASSLNSVVD